MCCGDEGEIRRNIETMQCINEYCGTKNSLSLSDATDRSRTENLYFFDVFCAPKY